jgi:uncharacterized protein with GYD domain
LNKGGSGIRSPRTLDWFILSGKTDNGVLGNCMAHWSSTESGTNPMPICITLYKLTKQGLDNFNGEPHRIEKGIKAWEEKGCKMVGFFAAICEYDYVGLAEAPNDGMVVNQKKEIG